MEQTTSIDHHQQQWVLNWLWPQEKVDDLYESRDTQRDQDEGRKEPPHSLNPAAGVGQTTGESWRSGRSIQADGAISGGLGAGERFKGQLCRIVKNFTRRRQSGIQKGERGASAVRLRSESQMYEDEKCVEAVHQGDE